MRAHLVIEVAMFRELGVTWGGGPSTEYLPVVGEYLGKYLVAVVH